MYVYFVRTGDAIKIGIATDINKRIVSIQVGNPHKIELLHTINTSDDEARKIESHIHELFKKTHLNGEWFHANQFMSDFIDHIKENGYGSHLDWIESRYQKAYGNIITNLKIKIDHDVINGNMVSLDKLKQDLGKLVNTIYAIPSLPNNMAEAVRKWIEKRNDPFVIRDIYSEFGITTRNAKKNISVILSRLVDDKMIKKFGDPPKCIYRKNSA
jgi:hypothetical protein